MERSQIPGIVVLDTSAMNFESALLGIVDAHCVDTVCVDYFDTVVRRTVAPEDVKRITCERIARMLRIEGGGRHLYAQRAALEAGICKQNKAEKGDPEFSLPELLARLWGTVPELQAMPKMRFVARAIDLEVSAEAGVQVVDDALLSALQSLKSKGVRIVLISDFYIPRKYFDRMLARHGIEEVFDATYVSSDFYKTKRTGALYDVVLADLGIEPAATLMLGDNPWSDIERALSRGIHPVQLDREHRISEYRRLAEAGGDHAATEYEVGKVFARAKLFDELALTLYLYIDRLYHDLSRRGAHDVFFMAREGQFLLKLFENYQDSRHLQHGAGRICAHYFKVSRRATFLPSLKTLAEEDFFVLFRQYRRISIRSFLNSLGLWEKIEESGLTLTHDIEAAQEDLPTSEALAELLANEQFREIYENARLHRLKAFKSYFDAFDVDADAKEVHFVDVGWKGSIQDNVRNIFDCLGAPYADFNIVGHYLGLVAPGNAGERNEKIGIVFDCSVPTRNCHVFNENRALFEIALGADHGSAFAYELDPVTGHHVLESEFEEAQLFHEKIVPLQERLFEKFKLVDRLLRDSHLSHSRLFSIASRHHARMVLKPTQDEIRWFEDVYHVENFGVFESSTFMGKTRRRALFAPVKFYLQLRRAPESIDLGFWPWLRVYQQGGPLIAARYARSRLKLLEN